MADIIDRIIKQARHVYDFVQIEEADVPEVVRWMRFEMEAGGTATEADLHLCEKRLRSGVMRVDGMPVKVAPAQ